MKNITKLLIILDGFGIAPPSDGNAVYHAKTPHLNKLLNRYPTLSLLCSDKTIGDTLSGKGSCSKGHFALGTGQIDYSSFDLVENYIDNILKNSTFESICKKTRQNNGAVHLFGILSDNKTISLTDHLYKLLDAFNLNKVEIVLHIFLDGVDTPKNSGVKYLEKLLDYISEKKLISLGSVCGRNKVMDNGYFWNDLKNYHDSLFEKKEKIKTNQLIKKIKDYYKEDIHDMDLPVISVEDFRVNDVDTAFLFNFSNHNFFQLSQLLSKKSDFKQFERNFNFSEIYSLTDTELCEMIFSPPGLKSVSEILNEQNIKQFYYSYADKFGFLNFFFHGKQIRKFSEKDEEIFSEEKNTYPKNFKNSTSKFTKKAIKLLLQNKYDFMVINYPHADLAGHYANFENAKKIIEVMDKNLGDLMSYVVSKNCSAIITSDHGNAEEMLDLKTLSPNPYHTNNPVPIIFVGPDFEGKKLAQSEVIENDLSTLTPRGFLIDVAPSLLKMFKIKKPAEMPGNSLF